MFWLLQHSGSWSIPFPVLCLNSAPAHPLAVFGKYVNPFFLFSDLLVLQLWEVQEQREVNEAEGHKRNLLCWRSYHTAVWTFYGKKKIALCPVELNKTRNSWMAGVVAKLSAHTAESSLHSLIKSWLLSGFYSLWHCSPDSHCTKQQAWQMNHCEMFS